MKSQLEYAKKLISLLLKEKESLDDFNPWHVNHVSSFLYYCCPECDFKIPTEEKFIEHAIANHDNTIHWECHINMGGSQTLASFGKVHFRASTMTTQGRTQKTG